MRRLYPILTVAVLGGLVVSATFAAPNMPTPMPNPDSPPAVAPAAAPLAIVPHRAIYSMKLANVKNGSNITDASGRMLFEWRDVCDGWAIQQHLQLHFTYSDGDDQDVISTELTWEAKDGKHFNYNIRRVTNGKETENFRGKAELKDDGTGVANYTIPQGKVEQLPAGTLFPTAHTEMILQKAALGEKLFTRRVFDGSDDDGSDDISAFVSPQQPIESDAALSKDVKTNPLLADAAWPVHMAFFKVGTETGEPDYEMDLSLLPNGIARHMTIDYSDFAVTGNLEDVQALPPQECP